MTKQVHILVSYKSFKPPHPASVSFFKGIQPLDDMTQIFRMNFWEVFSSIRIYNQSPSEVNYIGVRSGLSRIHIYYSDENKLNETEDDDFILYYTLPIEGYLTEEENRRLTQNTSQTLDAREDVLRQAGMGAFLGGLEAEIKGHTAWVSDQVEVGISEEIAAISAYYFYAFILLLRIERNQITADITPHIDASHRANRQVIKQRIRLINLERYFLTEDRTNNTYLKSICIKLEKKYRLHDKYQRAVARHSAFEHHMDNTSKILQSEKVSSLTNMISLLTIVSIPLVAMQVLFGINLAASVYSDWAAILAHQTTYAVLGLAIIVVLVPLASLWALDKLRNRS